MNSDLFNNEARSTHKLIHTNMGVKEETRMNGTMTEIEAGVVKEGAC